MLLRKCHKREGEKKKSENEGASRVSKDQNVLVVSSLSRGFRIVWLALLVLTISWFLLFAFWLQGRAWSRAKARRALDYHEVSIEEGYIYIYVCVCLYMCLCVCMCACLVVWYICACAWECAFILEIYFPLNPFFSFNCNLRALLNFLSFVHFLILRCWAILRPRALLSGSPHPSS